MENMNENKVSYGKYLERTHRPFYPIVFETMNYLKSIMTENEKRLLLDMP